MNGVLSALTEAGVSVEAEPLDMEMPDPDDRVFYEVVMEKRKEGEARLVTGNIRHFPKEPFIVTPPQLNDIILSGLR